MINVASNYKEYKGLAEEGKSGIRPIFAVARHGEIPHAPVHAAG
jgi:hypothetical protein